MPSRQIMEELKAFFISAALIMIAVTGQTSTPCTTSMISSFTPCANFLTGSTNNGSTPPTTCCDALRSLMSTGSDCACLVISANVPFQLPINRALTLTLAQACNMNGVPAQCKASASPLPAPGPALLGQNGPTLQPIAASPLSPEASKAMAAADAPKFERRQLAQAPASPPVQVEAPTKTPRIRPVMTPYSSASDLSYVSFPPFVLAFIGIIVVTWMSSH